MRSAEKVRLLVFALFFVVLIVFAILYHPVNAVSRPAEHGNAVLPSGKPLQKALLGLPTLAVPPNNPPTAETVALGRVPSCDPTNG